jgi:methionyl-tRNA formyltransferase
VLLALTQPDRPAGRGLQPATSAVKRLALARGVEVFQPQNFRDAKDVQRVRALRPDALVVAAYGLLLPAPLLEAGIHGALNIHASLLPRWRGAAPIQRALLAGDRETGISIMQMDEGLDTGPLIAQRGIPIGEDDDAGSLHERLAELGAQMIVAALTEIAAGRARAIPQPEVGVTYARKIAKHETLLDWKRPAAELERAVRAYRPSPGASARLGGELLKIWRTRVVQARLEPGEVGDGLIVGCGEGALQILELQRPGGRKLSVAQFLRGHPVAPGAHFR